jgi:hypothetical protein
MTNQDPMLAPYYSTDLDIPIVQIFAKNKHHAEAIINEFIDKISEIMSDKIRWHEANWEIQKNVLDEPTGEWKVS